MNQNTRSRLAFFVWAIFLFICYWPCPVGAEEDEVVVIVSKNAPDKDFTKKMIQQIFVGKLTMWSSNETIIVAVLDNDKIHDAFLRKYVHRNPAQFMNTWRQLMFTGKAKKPKPFSTIEELIRFVSDNRLAIGYITKNAADESVQMIQPSD